MIKPNSYYTRHNWSDLVMQKTKSKHFKCKAIPCVSRGRRLLSLPPPRHSFWAWWICVTAAIVTAWLFSLWSDVSFIPSLQPCFQVFLPHQKYSSFPWITIESTTILPLYLTVRFFFRKVNSSTVICLRIGVYQSRSPMASNFALDPSIPKHLLPFHFQPIQSNTEDSTSKHKCKQRVVELNITTMKIEWRFRYRGLTFVLRAKLLFLSPQGHSHANHLLHAHSSKHNRHH